MLILTRKIGETIRIADEITVMVLSIQGNQVKLGITAPRSVEVHREEIYERIALEKASGIAPRPIGRAASTLAPPDATEADREEPLSVAGVTLSRVAYRRRKLKSG